MKILVILCLFSAQVVFSQNQESRILELEKENQALRENYRLFEGSAIIVKDSIEFRYISANGSKEDSTLIIELIVCNRGAQFNSTVDKIYFVDEMANEFKSAKIEIGSEDRWKFKPLYKDSPIRVRVTFEDIKLASVFVSKVNFQFHNAGIKTTGFSIDGNNIIWE